MDLFLPIVLFIVFCVLFSICGWCCKKHRQGTVYGYAGNPTVTVAQQASSVIPPYPVSVAHPHPQQVSTPGFASTGGYQTAPYPQNTSPYPPAPGGGYQNSAPYPSSGPAPYPSGGSAPYPRSGAAAPYPTSGGAPYPSTGAAPYPAGGASPYPTGGAAPYPAGGGAPYPSGGSAPYPPSGSTPYPPTSASGAPYPNQPPSYMEAVAQPPAEPNKTNTTYTKQAPYNPGY